MKQLAPGVCTRISIIPFIYCRPYDNWAGYNYILATDEDPAAATLILKKLSTHTAKMIKKMKNKGWGV